MQTKINIFLKELLKSRWYPGIFRWPTAAVFAVIVYQLLFGDSSPHDNFGTAMTWIFWWSIIPLTFLVLGRFWCAICPFATLSDVIQKFVGNHRPVPRFLKKYGIWIIDFLYILITWNDHVFGMVENPRGSGIIMLLLITGVIISGAFFERRTWCRYLCFLGGLSGNYSRSASLELRGTPEKCQKCTVTACYKGGEKAPGCPMFEFPRTMQSNARCNFCGYCVKNCPNDSIKLSVRIPSKELWFIRKPRFDEAFLAVIIMGIVFVQNITMLDIWAQAQHHLEVFLGTNNYAITFTVIFAVAMSIPVALLYAASWFGSRLNKDSVHMNFARFGYALIPLDFAGHMAHNLFHLFAEGKSVFYSALSMFGFTSHPASTAVLSSGTIEIMQFLLLFLGAAGSVYTAYRIAKSSYGQTVRKKNSYIPYAVLLILLTLLNIYIFLLPMAHRT
ncbi:4Fe-4S binding protein [Pectinatus haikarae]|uniref:Polyferredoxin n=1 Tax=Pectinatus haikarae TaxID=349096 RepID=A0ABT9YAH6_9FIRM|nr:4Fe-4S binding protein [Pectinatus haikarae]MDQ0204850.1 polyferredoxin [Pectinatus haikarae]